jgi:DNA-binding MarR family transcriptional regulator
MTHTDQRSYFFKIDTTIKKIRSFMQKNLDIAKIDLTVDQWVVIDHIHPKPGISQNELAEITVKDAPTVTRILDLLVKKGFIERKMAGGDRRKFNIFLTSEGEKVYEKALVAVAKVRIAAYKNLEDTDFDELVRIMDVIYANVNK